MKHGHVAVFVQSMKLASEETIGPCTGIFEVHGALFMYDQTRSER